MAYPKWFSEVEYLSAKLAQLQKADVKDPAGNAFTSISQVADAFQAAGLTAFDHYNTYGSKEGLSPSTAFNAQEYCSFKLRALQANEATKAEWAGKTWQDVEYGINKHMSLGQHYANYGAAEGVAMSNAFDGNVYLEAKLALLVADPNYKAAWEGKKPADLAAEFQKLGLDPYTHYMTFKGATGEVPADLDVSSKDPVNPGGNAEKFMLTAKTDTLVGSALNDIFVADKDVTVTNGDTTLNATDSIDGKGGVNELHLYGNDNVVNLSSATIKNVQIVRAIGTGDNTTVTPIDVSGIADVKEVWVKTATDKNAITAKAAQQVGFEGKIHEAQTVTVSDRATAKTAAMAVNNATVDTSITYTATTAHIDTLNLSAEGTNSIADLTIEGVKTLNIAGSGDLEATIKGATTAALATVNASAAKGDLDLNLSSATTLTADAKVTLGAGNDRVLIDGTMTSLKLDGGLGDDVLAVGTATQFDVSNSSALVTMINGAKGFEGLEMAAANVTSLAAADFTGISDFLFSTTTTKLAITKAETGDSFSFEGAVGNGTAASTSTAGSDGLTITGQGLRANFTVNLLESSSIFGQAGGANGGSGGFAGGDALKVVSTDTLNIVSDGQAHSITGGAGSAGSGAAGGAGGNGIENAAGLTVIVTGSADLTIAGGAGGSGSGAGADGASFNDSVILNAKDFHGKLTTGGSAQIDEITVGDGGSVITGTAKTDTITFGAGKDIYVGGVAEAGLASMDTVKGFTAGTDKFALTASSATTGSSSTVLVKTLATSAGVSLEDALTAALTTAEFTAAMKWGVVTITGGDASVNGLYVVNNSGAGFAAANDAVIKVVGTDALTAGDFLV